VIQTIHSAKQRNLPQKSHDDDIRTTRGAKERKAGNIGEWESESKRGGGGEYGEQREGGTDRRFLWGFQKIGEGNWGIDLEEGK